MKTLLSPTTSEVAVQWVRQSSTKMATSGKIVAELSSLQAWLGEELEMRGIDAVIYTRYILSILKEDYIQEDWDMLAEKHFFPPSKRESVAAGRAGRGGRRSDRQKIIIDGDQQKKSAAIQCLLSLADEESGIESLVDELYLKLKEHEFVISGNEGKSGSATESNVTESGSSDSDEPSTDPTQRYYAAFPALSTDVPPTIQSPIPAVPTSGAWATKVTKGLFRYRSPTEVARRAVSVTQLSSDHDAGDFTPQDSHREADSAACGNRRSLRPAEISRRQRNPRNTNHHQRCKSRDRTSRRDKTAKRGARDSHSLTRSSEDLRVSLSPSFPPRAAPNVKPWKDYEYMQPMFLRPKISPVDANLSRVKSVRSNQKTDSVLDFFFKSRVALTSPSMSDRCECGLGNLWECTTGCATWSDMLGLEADSEDQSWYTEPLDMMMKHSPTPSRRLYNRRSLISSLSNLSLIECAETLHNDDGLPVDHLGLTSLLTRLMDNNILDGHNIEEAHSVVDPHQVLLPLMVGPCSQPAVKRRPLYALEGSADWELFNEASGEVSSEENDEKPSDSAKEGEDSQGKVDENILLHDEVEEDVLDAEHLHVLDSRSGPLEEDQVRKDTNEDAMKEDQFHYGIYASLLDEEGRKRLLEDGIMKSLMEELKNIVFDDYAVRSGENEKGKKSPLNKESIRDELLDSTPNDMLNENVNEGLFADRAKISLDDRELKSPLQDSTKESLLEGSAKKSQHEARAGKSVLVDSPLDCAWECPLKHSASRSLLEDSAWESLLEDSVWESPFDDTAKKRLLEDSAWEGLLGDSAKNTLLEDSTKKGLLKESTLDVVLEDNAKKRLFEDSVWEGPLERNADSGLHNEPRTEKEENEKEEDEPLYLFTYPRSTTAGMQGKTLRSKWEDLGITMSTRSETGDIPGRLSPPGKQLKTGKPSIRITSHLAPDDPQCISVDNCCTWSSTGKEAKADDDDEDDDDDDSFAMSDLITTCDNLSVSADSACCVGDEELHDPCTCGNTPSQQQQQQQRSYRASCWSPNPAVDFSLASPILGDKAIPRSCENDVLDDRPLGCFALDDIYDSDDDSPVHVGAQALPPCTSYAGQSESSLCTCTNSNNDILDVDSNNTVASSNCDTQRYHPTASLSHYPPSPPPPPPPGAWPPPVSMLPSERADLLWNYPADHHYASCSGGRVSGLLLTPKYEGSCLSHLWDVNAVTHCGDALHTSGGALHASGGALTSAALENQDHLYKHLHGYRNDEPPGVGEGIAQSLVSLRNSSFLDTNSPVLTMFYQEAIPHTHSPKTYTTTTNDPMRSGDYCAGSDGLQLWQNFELEPHYFRQRSSSADFPDANSEKLPCRNVNAAEVFASENSAFKDNIPPRVLHIPHVQSEPALDAQNSAHGRVYNHGRLVQVRSLYRSDKSALVNSDAASSTHRHASDTQSPQGVAVQPHTHFVPIENEKRNDTKQSTNDTAERVPTPHGPVPEVCPVLGRQSTYQLYHHPDDDVDDQSELPYFVPRFQVQKATEKCCQTRTPGSAGTPQLRASNDGTPHSHTVDIVSVIEEEEEQDEEAPSSSVGEPSNSAEEVEEEEAKSSNDPLGLLLYDMQDVLEMSLEDVEQLMNSESVTPTCEPSEQLDHSDLVDGVGIKTFDDATIASSKLAGLWEEARDANTTTSTSVSGQSVKQEESSGSSSELSSKLQVGAGGADTRWSSIWSCESESDNATTPYASASDKPPVWDGTKNGQDIHANLQKRFVVPDVSADRFIVGQEAEDSVNDGDGHDSDFDDVFIDDPEVQLQLAGIDPNPDPDQLIFSSDLEKHWFSSRSTFKVQVPNPSQHKHGGQRKPCTFFMEGNCRRTDCKFAHDISNITCRFWEEGTCFKGLTCPFLHGYARRRTKNRLDN